MLRLHRHPTAPGSDDRASVLALVSGIATALHVRQAGRSRQRACRCRSRLPRSGGLQTAHLRLLHQSERHGVACGGADRIPPTAASITSATSPARDMRSRATDGMRVPAAEEATHWQLQAMKRSPVIVLFSRPSTLRRLPAPDAACDAPPLEKGSCSFATASRSGRGQLPHRVACPRQSSVVVERMNRGRAERSAGTRYDQWRRRRLVMVIPQPTGRSNSGGALNSVEAFMDKPTITLARNKCYVDGQWVGEPKLPVTNKATGEIMARVPDFGEAETRQRSRRPTARCRPGRRCWPRSAPSASVPGST
jgi:hypothetical protein